MVDPEMADMRLRSNNRKLPPLPPADTLPDDDHRRWAILFTAHRRRKRWSYVRLALQAGLSERTTVRACTEGDCLSSTILKLCVALDLTLPTPPPVLTAREAIYGRSH
jgi:hypothetical protein